MTQDAAIPAGRSPTRTSSASSPPLDPRRPTGTEALLPGTGTPARATADGHRLTQHQRAPDGWYGYPRAAAGVGWS